MYNVITLDPKKLGTEAEVIGQYQYYRGALQRVLDFTPDTVLRPLTAHAVVALALYRPLEAWEVWNKNTDNRLWLLAIQEADEDVEAQE